MTIEEFREQHCKMCGSQRCYGDEESISTCGNYNGDIIGIEKKESLSEMLKKANELIDKMKKDFCSPDIMCEKINHMDNSEKETYINSIIDIYNNFLTEESYTYSTLEKAIPYGYNIKLIFENKSFIIVPQVALQNLIDDRFSKEYCLKETSRFVRKLDTLLRGDI